MKVKELIAALEALEDQEAYVVVRGYEDGVNDVSSVESTLIARDQHDEWYYGQHEQISQPEGYDNVARAYELVGDNELKDL